MIKIRILCAFLIVGSGNSFSAERSQSSHAVPIPKQAKSLIQQFEPLNEICLSDYIEKPEIAAACDKRDLIYQQLKISGWCLGPSNLPMPAREWMSCTKINQPERIRVFAMERNRKIIDSGVVGDTRVVTGDTVPARNILYRLYLDKPCKIPVSNARNMRLLYWTNGSLVRIGCWFQTLDDGYVILYSDGTLEKQPSWELLPQALINIDGSATITEPEYDSDTAYQKLNSAQWKKRLQMREQGMY